MVKVLLLVVDYCVRSKGCVRNIGWEWFGTHREVGKTSIKKSVTLGACDVNMYVPEMDDPRGH